MDTFAKDFNSKISTKPDSILKIDTSNQRQFMPIKNLLNQSLHGEKNISYIVVGDSKRHVVADYPALYQSILDQLHVNFHKNAIGGMTAKRWLSSTNIRVGFNTAIQDATGDQGERTIIEYSLGGNDYNLAKATGNNDLYGAIAPSIRKSIIDLKKALPKVKIVLVSPLGSYRKALKKLYRDISKEFDLPLIENPMDRYRDNPETKSSYFFEGSIHPNKKGAKCLVYSILYALTDKEIHKEISIFH